MQIIKGKISKKTTKSGVSKNGKPWSRTSLLVEGSWYSSFDDIEFSEGDLVAISYDENAGGFKNISSIMAWDGEEYHLEDVTDNVTSVKPSSNSEKVKKIILSNYDETKLIELIEDFEEKHNVFATQYAMAFDDIASCMKFSVMLFYKE